MVTEEKLVLSVKSAGELLGVSKPHAYKLVRLGQMPGVIRLGRRLVVSRPALMKFLENAGSQPVTTAK